MFINSLSFWLVVKTGLEGPGLSTMQKIGFLFFMVGVPYCWARLEYTVDFEHQGTLAKGMRCLEKFYKVANLANFLLFLNTGWYRTVVDRVLKAGLVYQKPNIIQVETLETFNRKLVWGASADILTNA
ncbi:hypothetical protein L7F22_008743 [Adiantum nelumboides]|nr:hypothetical protein [Adiantum nelumboides]